MVNKLESIRELTPGRNYLTFEQMNIIINSQTMVSTRILDKILNHYYDKGSRETADCCGKII